MNDVAEQIMLEQPLGDYRFIVNVNCYPGNAADKDFRQAEKYYAQKFCVKKAQADSEYSACQMVCLF